MKERKKERTNERKKERKKEKERKNEHVYRDTGKSQVLMISRQKVLLYQSAVIIMHVCITIIRADKRARIYVSRKNITTPDAYAVSI